MPTNEPDWLGELTEVLTSLDGPAGAKAAQLVRLLSCHWPSSDASSRTFAHADRDIALPDLRDPLTFIETVVEPVARRIGTAWEEDAMTFVDVTIISHQLHDLLHLHERQYGVTTLPDGGGSYALLTIAGGRQHGLGLACVAYQMREGGWSVDVADHRDVARLLSSRPYDLLCISVGHTDLVAELANGIRAFRIASRRPDLVVAVGGQGVANDGNGAGAGADIVAGGVPELLWKFGRLLVSRGSPRS